MESTLYPFACGRCGKSHRTKALLAAHEATHEGKGAFVKVDACAKCGLELTSGYCVPCHRKSKCGRRNR